jgi:hypothetical protein
MGFDGLPKDLKNVIADFTWQCKWEMAEKDMNTCEEITRMQISPVFHRHVMWSNRYHSYIPNPLKKFEPIRNFTNNWSDFVDWHAVQDMLWRLDFRRKFVKLVHTRDEWRRMFAADWRSIEKFDCFYRFLLYTRVPCFKPIWKPCGFQGLKTFRSPYTSAQWWLSGAFL